MRVSFFKKKQQKFDSNRMCKFQIDVSSPILWGTFVYLKGL